MVGTTTRPGQPLESTKKRPLGLSPPLILEWRGVHVLILRFLASVLALFGFWCQGTCAQRASLAVPFDDSKQVSDLDKRESDFLHGQALLRHPVALALDEMEHRLFVSNRRSGTLSVIDTNELTVQFETRLGRTLGDLVFLPNRDSIERRLLAVDEGADELLVLSLPGPDVWDVQVLDRVPVSRYPVSVTVSADSSRCFVACLWSRRLDLIELAPSTGPACGVHWSCPSHPESRWFCRVMIVCWWRTLSVGSWH